MFELKWKRACAAGLFFLFIFLLAGCAGRHFHDAGSPSAPPARFDITKSGGQEYWTGIVFSGDKIGFSHFSLKPVADAPGSFQIDSDAVFSFRLLMVQKRFAMKSRDIIGEDLSLKSFEYDLDLDGSQMHEKGDIQGSELSLSTVSSGNERKEIIHLREKIYPMSIIYLYPAVHGLEVGRSYEYPVFDDETRAIFTLRQKVLAYEESDLFEGRAFKVSTSFRGDDTTSWIDRDARPMLEQALGGLFVSGLESESSAKSYLASAALNKNETMLNFSLVKADKRIPNARETVYLEAALIGMGRGMSIPSDSRQQCSWKDGRLVCRVSTASPEAGAPLLKDAEKRAYLQPTFAAPINDERIKSVAASIVKGITDPRMKMEAFLAWIKENIRKESLDVFTAIDVLEKKRAECQGHAVLYTAFARSAGIPTRVVNGLAYAEDFDGFLYHTWAESYVGGRWIAVDPTFAQIPPDATHIKLVEGENPEDLLPMVNVIGKIKAEIIQFR